MTNTQEDRSMVIDIHNHIVAGEQLQTFQAGLINSAGFF